MRKPCSICGCAVSEAEPCRCGRVKSARRPLESEMPGRDFRDPVVRAQEELDRLVALEAKEKRS